MAAFRVSLFISLAPQLAGCRAAAERAAERGGGFLPLRRELLDRAGRASRLGVGGNAEAGWSNEAEAGECRRQLCRRVHLVGVLPVPHDLLYGCAGCSRTQPPVETPALAALVGDDPVAEAPPELERDAAAGDRPHRVYRAADSVGVRQLGGCSADLGPRQRGEGVLAGGDEEGVIAGGYVGGGVEGRHPRQAQVATGGEEENLLPAHAGAEGVDPVGVERQPGKGGAGQSWHAREVVDLARVSPRVER